jgi:hypothetical protein
MSSEARAEVIYRGGTIHTVVDDRPTVEAIAVADGRIIATGIEDHVMRTRGDATKVVDLTEKTLLPAFIDGHSHYIMSLTVANQVKAYAPPAGPGTDPDAIVASLRTFRDERRIPTGELILAYGYATIDMFLEAYEFARAGDYSRPWNVTTIHTQGRDDDPRVGGRTSPLPPAQSSRRQRPVVVPARPALSGRARSPECATDRSPVVASSVRTRDQYTSSWLPSATRKQMSPSQRKSTRRSSSTRNAQ